MGLQTHCTMLYNHVETYEERIDHLLRLRDLQDETGGFMAFIPLPFHPENTVFERRGWKFTTGHDDLKMQAVSRLMLDNIEHVKAYWIMISTPLAQVALHFGANDIQGTVVEETIAHAAGAVTPTEEKVADLVRVIREAGRMPVQRDTFYNVAAPLRRVPRLIAPRPRRLHQHVPRGVGARPAPAARARRVEVTGVPTALNRMLRRGRARRRQRLERRVRAQHAERYVLLPSLCVGSDGAVDVRAARHRSCRCRAVRSDRGDQRSRRRRVALVRTLLPARPRSAPRATRPTPAC